MSENQEKGFEFESLYTRERHEAGAECKIYAPDGTLSPLVIRVRGIDSDVYRAKAKEHRQICLEAMRDGTLAEVKDDELDVEALVACTIGWNDDHPDIPEFSVEKCREVYTQAVYVRLQVDAFVGKRANFTKG